MVGGRSAAAVGPSCGERGTPQGVDRDSPPGGGGVAGRAPDLQRAAPERKSHLEWAL